MVIAGIVTVSISSVVFAGIVAIEREECFVNHYPRFTWKEEAMKIGVESYLSVLMEYLN